MLGRRNFGGGIISGKVEELYQKGGNPVLENRKE
jgi:hypothetical protein